MRVLVVEDQKEIAGFIKNGLRAENFSVDCAFDGAQGLWLAKTNDYDAIVLDIGLPEKNGLDVCQELRHVNKMAPIIMLSVISDSPTKTKALNIGADDYLIKPFSFEELLARIRALLRREKRMTGAKLKISDLEMDSLAHTVTRGDKPVALSKKEFELLEYLMRNAGTTLTRSMILEHVWDMNTDPFTNTIDVHILSLRKKIESSSKPKLIHTVSGYGYKLES